MLKILRTKRAILWIFVVLVSFSACKDRPNIEKEVAAIPMKIEVVRFDREFDAASPADIPTLRIEYPYLFPAPDSVWANKISDSLQRVLRNEVGRTFPDFDLPTRELEPLFKHIKYYDPTFVPPTVITMTNDVDYDHRVIWADSLLFIGLDNYLGPQHRFYEAVPKYVAYGLDARFIPVDVAEAYALQKVPGPKDRSFLERMVYYGKVLYLKERLLPQVPEEEMLHYTPEQWQWARENEDPIWRNFIENEYLYSTNSDLAKRFLYPAPFSKFGLQLDNESPGRIGQYLGLQIVKAFMERNPVGIWQMADLPGETIFRQSNFKPSK